MAINSYDEVPYPSLPARRTHPSHLAAIARLFGMVPPSPGRCRLLELGCASGENLLPLAADFPDSHLVGIDLSVRQIEAGRSVVEQLGLSNIDLRRLDLHDFGEDQGTFDYILCHGVFSWVPRAVQDRILEIGLRHLAGNGVFFASYNTYPGWHLRGVVRDMMVYHVRGIEDPATRVAQARALPDFLVGWISWWKGPCRATKATGGCCATKHPFSRGEMTATCTTSTWKM
jgi:SAM-dependent methyltransferase